MKVSNLLTWGLLSTCLLASCSDDDDKTIKETDEIVFNSQITNVQSRVNGTSWNDNDEIGIFMQVEGNEVANKKYLAKADGSLTAAPEYAFRYPAEGTASFLAYYPFNAALDGKNVSVSVADQSNPSKIDFLYSNNATGIKNGETVTLNFSHKLSNIVINIKGDETVKDTKGIAVALSGMNTTASFNLADGTLTASDSKADIKLNTNEAGSLAEAIILPTTSVEGTKLVFSLNDKTYEWAMTLPENKGIEGGCKYTFNATVSIFEGQPTVKMGNAIITDWTDKAGGDIDVDFGDGEEDKPVDENVLLDEPFNANQGNFTIHDIKLPEGSTYVWKGGSFDNEGTIVPPLTYMKASAFVGGNKQASESWLVSPELQIPADKKTTLSFHHCHKFADDANAQLTLMVAEAGTKASAEATGWTKVEIPTYGSGNDYKYVTASIDLATFAGKKIQFAFRYISSTKSAPTWQINNVKVFLGEGGDVNPDPEPKPDPEPDPEPQPDPVEGTILFDETFGEPGNKKKISIDKYTGWTDQHKLTYSDPLISGNKSNADVRQTSTMDGHVWFPAKKDAALRIAGFDAKAYKTVQLTYSITANIQGSAKGNQNVIKVSTDKGDVTVPAVDITESNKYQTVTVTLPNDFTYVQFTSETKTNTLGYRIDNVKVVGLDK